MSLWRQSFHLANSWFLRRTVKIAFTDLELRYHKRWVSPTLKEIARRRKAVGPEPEHPRSSYLEWNYEIEIGCFGKRLGEKFDKNVLKEAFVQQEWANIQEFKAKEAGDDTFEPIQHNYSLSQEGLQIITDSIKEFYANLYPLDVVNAVCNYLTTDDMLAHIGKHLGIKDLIKSIEYPPETKTLADAFKAVVATLSYSDPERVKQFVNDFVISQMTGKDIFDVWTPERPYDYLMNLLKDKGVNEVEPRLCNQSASNTILANYQVGLYHSKDKSCLGLGWGENIQIAKETAALDAIQRIYANYNSK